MSTGNNISAIINYRIPQFVRLDHPTFTAFIKAYYEWTETQGPSLRNMLELGNAVDIDTTFDEFISSFKSQYLNGFPETLAINKDTGAPLDERKLIKNIKQFYRARGTEKTYELLFRILYNTNVEFYYPKLDILRVSDGKWTQKKTIRTSSSLGSNCFRSLGKKIYQVNSSGTVISSAFVENVSRYQLGVFEVSEYELTGVSGTFVANQPILFNDGTEILTESKAYSVVSSISIISGGSNYRVGDKLVFTTDINDVGQKAEAEVSQVSSTGKILKIKINNFGVNYSISPTISVTSVKGSGFSGTANIGTICNYEGYYSNNDGKLSSNKVLQDNHYYQNFSYVLKTEVVISRYRDIIKKLIHPAGLAFFGQVLIKRCIEGDMKANSELSRYEVPIIGHYLPYTFNTYDNLADWFMINSDKAGYYPSLHDNLIITAGNCNPLSNGIEYESGATSDWASLTGFTRADPFWIIYDHPNERIGNNGTVVARIPYEERYNFAGSTGLGNWQEWTLTASRRSEWLESFTGPRDHKYVTLQYDNTSEFYKISIGSFLEMPIGEKFDCRSTTGTVRDYGPSPNF